MYLKYIFTWLSNFKTFSEQYSFKRRLSAEAHQQYANSWVEKRSCVDDRWVYRCLGSVGSLSNYNGRCAKYTYIQTRWASRSVVLRARRLERAPLCLLLFKSGHGLRGCVARARISTYLLKYILQPVLTSNHSRYEWFSSILPNFYHQQNYISM